jgi:hypothetical protein
MFENRAGRCLEQEWMVSLRKKENLDHLSHFQSPSGLLFCYLQWFQGYTQTRGSGLGWVAPGKWGGVTVRVSPLKVTSSSSAVSRNRVSFIFHTHTHTQFTVFSIFFQNSVGEERCYLLNKITNILLCSIIYFDRSCCVAQVGFKLCHPPQPPKCWDYRRTQPPLAQNKISNPFYSRVAGYLADWGCIAFVDTARVKRKWPQRGMFTMLLHKWIKMTVMLKNVRYFRN